MQDGISIHTSGSVSNINFGFTNPSDERISNQNNIDLHQHNPSSYYETPDNRKSVIQG